MEMQEGKWGWGEERAGRLERGEGGEAGGLERGQGGGAGVVYFRFEGDEAAAPFLCVV